MQETVSLRVYNSISARTRKRSTSTRWRCRSTRVPSDVAKALTQSTQCLSIFYNRQSTLPFSTVEFEPWLNLKRLLNEHQRIKQYLTFLSTVEILTFGRAIP
ncbi:hypothetical protein E2C01_024309 [Portunus trituberculatus]|uniref:Uncharacterized protein n=1 Tax=Portunus trituberculatus TaxID=210409 RepID=A0A5B7EDH4_PORTR|nr:hypothetical protein [Portunus trituberculatus]